MASDDKKEKTDEKKSDDGIDRLVRFLTSERSAGKKDGCIDWVVRSANSLLVIYGYPANFYATVDVKKCDIKKAYEKDDHECFCLSATVNWVFSSTVQQEWNVGDEWQVWVSISAPLSWGPQEVHNRLNSSSFCCEFGQQPMFVLASDNWPEHADYYIIDRCYCMYCGTVHSRGCGRLCGEVHDWRSYEVEHYNDVEHCEETWTSLARQKLDSCPKCNKKWHTHDEKPRDAKPFITAQDLLDEVNEH
jgi:hypothetical protein